jgi:hypothetical protein
VKISPAPRWKPEVMLSTKTSEEEYIQVDLKGADDVNVNWTELALYTTKWQNFLTIVMSPHDL